MRAGRACRAARREKLCLGSLLCSLPAVLGLARGEFSEHCAGSGFNAAPRKLIRRPGMLFAMPKFAALLETGEGGRRSCAAFSELEHLEVIRRRAAAAYGLKHMYVRVARQPRRRAANV